TDPDDRRKVILNLSDRGAEVYQAILVMAMELERKLLGQMPVQKQDDFRGMLTDMLANISRMRKG
ncbi:hypothetical protein MNBD_ALPHA01-1535, partial [hydrothermal vent metagenome]